MAINRSRGMSTNGPHYSVPSSSSGPGTEADAIGGVHGVLLVRERAYANGNLACDMRCATLDPSWIRMIPGSVAERWATCVVRAIDADKDPKTLTAWAHAIGVSRSALCECCRLVRVSAHDARDFARLVRVIYRSGERWEPEAFLDLADTRTLKKLLVRGGLPESSTGTPTLQEFLERQQFVAPDSPGLLAFRHLLFGAAARAQP
jgi:hypothetical protein